ncbi:MAG: ATP-dependent helicase, partial [Candidatus Electrothrix sp. AUS1_2]|nr:ATP-dependent helicase [Candidatus Electrothrix sp. AUS1_2]
RKTENKNNVPLTRILLMLEKVGSKTAGKILSSVIHKKDPVAALRQYKSSAQWQQNLHVLADMLLDLRAADLTVADRFDLIMTWYQPVFERIYYDDYPKRQYDLDYLGSLAADYFDIQSFVDDTTLDPSESSDKKNKKLILSTIHSAKGLEWDVVFVLGLSDGLFPRHNAVSDELEEERRLLYVAATRAKKQLYLCSPQLIRTPDRRFQPADLSPFLNISSCLYDEVSFLPEKQFSEVF